MTEKKKPTATRKSTKRTPRTRKAASKKKPTAIRKQKPVAVKTEPQKKHYTISAGPGGVFSTGMYENERSGELYVSITYLNVESFPNQKTIDADIKKAIAARRKLHNELYEELQMQEEISRQKALEKRYKEIRWYDSGTPGLKYPSVTSVIDTVNPIKWFVDESQLRGLAARGEIGDIILQKYIESGEWLEPEKIPECYRYIDIMKTEGYDLEGDLPAFVEKYKVKFTGGHLAVVNHDYRYAGTYDCECLFGDSKTATLADLKWFLPDKKGKLRTFKQLAAYAMASPKKYDRLAIIPINGNTKQGFSAPVFTDNIDEYFKMFLEDRKKFKKMLGV